MVTMAASKSNIPPADSNYMKSFTAFEIDLFSLCFVMDPVPIDHRRGRRIVYK